VTKISEQPWLNVNVYVRECGCLFWCGCVWVGVCVGVSGRALKSVLVSSAHGARFSNGFGSF